jgi:hypothetical protein
MRRVLLLTSTLIFLGCGSSSASPEPGPTDAGSDSASDATPDADEGDSGAPDSGQDAQPDGAQDAETDGGQDAGPPTGEHLLQDGPSDRVVPHVAARNDGTAYLAWYALNAGKYTLRMQRLDTAGKKLWAADGVEASSVDSESWVMDFGLATDAQGNAVLAYSDTTDFDVRVQRVDGEGDAAWGEGTVLTGSDADGFTPHLVLCSDGAMAVAWDELRSTGGDSTSHVVVQRVDTAGQVGWTQAFSVDPDGDVSPQFSQILPSVDGSVIVVWIENGGVNHPGDAYAQRVDAEGKPVWGAKKKINGSEPLPFPMRPVLSTDGQGGLFAAWSGLKGNGFYGRVQHVDADGVVSWDAEGVPVSTDTTMMHMPAAVGSLTGEPGVVVASKRTDANQSTAGIVIQGFDATGAALWEDPGATILPALKTEGGLVADLRSTSNSVATFYAKGVTNTWELTTHVAVVSLTGAAMPEVTDLSTTPSEKLHPDVSTSVGGGYWLVWEDLRSGTPAVWGSFWPSP